jgi:hypothetical protein
MYSALTGHILKGREPWTMKNTLKDSECLEKKDFHKVKFINKFN